MSFKGSATGHFSGIGESVVATEALLECLERAGRRHSATRAQRPAPPITQLCFFYLPVTHRRIHLKLSSAVDVERPALSEYRSLHVVQQRVELSPSHVHQQRTDRLKMLSFGALEACVALVVVFICSRVVNYYRCAKVRCVQVVPEAVRSCY